jgi:hypothetical protein
MLKIDKVYNLLYTLLMSDLIRSSQNSLEALKGDAVESLRRVLYTSKDEKTVTKVATDILRSLSDTAEVMGRPIVIKDSQIQILVQVARESFGGADGNTQKTLQDGDRHSCSIE